MNLAELKQKKCQPCKSGEAPLDSQIVSQLVAQLGWELNPLGHLFKEFKFANFAEALAFTNRVGVLAEAEDHHPDILLQWGKVTITLYTHSIKGLSLNDFILASKITIH